MVPGYPASDHVWRLRNPGLAFQAEDRRGRCWGMFRHIAYSLEMREYIMRCVRVAIAMHYMEVEVVLTRCGDDVVRTLFGFS
jgi:hypothetical protein